MAAHGPGEAPLGIQLQQLLDLANLNLGDGLDMNLNLIMQGVEELWVEAEDEEEEDEVQLFFEAVRAGDMDEVMRFLLHDPTLLEEMDESGDTALMVAAADGHVGLVMRFVEMGAEVSAPSIRTGVTALHRAAARGHVDVVELLLESGANPRATEGRGRTALMHAVRKSHTNVVKALLPRIKEEGIDDRDRQGRTALAVACKYAEADVIKLLLTGGSDHLVKNKVGLTPLQIVRERGQHDCVQLLESWDAEMQRAYTLHRAMRLQELHSIDKAGVSRKLPNHRWRHELKRLDWPSVEVVRTVESLSYPHAAARYWEVRDDKEKDAMVKYVVNDMPPELGIELMAALRHFKS